MRSWISYLAASLVTLMGCAPAASDNALIAVATNFVVTAQALEADFEHESVYDISLTSGATGQLYAQIMQGAPYDVFLSADQARPAKLSEYEYAVGGTQFSYARGQIALWSPTFAQVSQATLKEDFRYLAMANPDLAPYGRAAREVLSNLRIGGAKPTIVFGENVGQAYGLVATGNAEIGIVAVSSLLGAPNNEYWIFPSQLYSPIFQDAVLLERAKDNEAARAFLTYLQSPQARLVMSRHGYLKP